MAVVRATAVPAACGPSWPSTARVTFFEFDALVPAMLTVTVTHPDHSCVIGVVVVILFVLGYFGFRH